MFQFQHHHYYVFMSKKIMIKLWSIYINIIYGIDLDWSEFVEGKFCWFKSFFHPFINLKRWSYLSHYIIWHHVSTYVYQRNYNNPRYDFISTLQWNAFKQNSTLPPFCFKNTKSMIARQINSVNCVRQIECFHCFNCINDRLILYYCADRYLLKGNYRDRPRVKIQFNHFLFI